MAGGNGGPRAALAYDEVQMVTGGGYSVPGGGTQRYETPTRTIGGNPTGYAIAMAAPTMPVREYGNLPNPPEETDA